MSLQKIIFLVVLDLKVFVCNAKSNLLPNLWYMCKKDLDPQVVTSSDQHVLFKFVIDYVQVSFTIVYASTSHIIEETYGWIFHLA